MHNGEKCNRFPSFKGFFSQFFYNWLGTQLFGHLCSFKTVCIRLIRDSPEIGRARELAMWQWILSSSAAKSVLDIRWQHDRVCPVIKTITSFFQRDICFFFFLSFEKAMGGFWGAIGSLERKYLAISECLQAFSSRPSVPSYTEVTLVTAFMAGITKQLVSSSWNANAIQLLY